MIGVPIGFLIGIVVVQGVPRLIIAPLLNRWYPPLPMFDNYSSEKHEYKYERSNQFGTVWSCRLCNKQFLRTRKRLQQVLPDGSLVPYLTFSSGIWKRE